VASVVVVGGGLAGLAVAARLARQRHGVTLLDRAVPGAASGTTDDPASFTLPAVYRDLFRKTGRPLEPGVRLVPVEPARRYLFPDGRVLDLPTGSRKAMLEAFDRGLGRAAATEWDAFVSSGGARWRAVRHRLGPDGASRDSAGLVVQPARLEDPANRMLLAWYADDAGLGAALGSARQAGDLAVLPYLEQAFGAWQVDGGLRALAAATAERARRCGAALLGGSEVVQVVVQDGAVRGVRTADGSTYDAELVVDAVGLPARDRGGWHEDAGPAGLATATVHLRSAELDGLPVETVLLPARGRQGMVLVRPDVAADPTAAELRSTVPGAPAAGDESALARHLLATIAGAGIAVAGEVTGVSVRSTRSVRAPERVRRWTRRSSTAGWLDLRSASIDPDLDGMLRALPHIAGALAVPWQGLAAALAASSCGTVPRRTPG